MGACISSSNYSLYQLCIVDKQINIYGNRYKMSLAGILPEGTTQETAIIAIIHAITGPGFTFTFLENNSESQSTKGEM